MRRGTLGDKRLLSWALDSGLADETHIKETFNNAKSDDPEVARAAKEHLGEIAKQHPDSDIAAQAQQVQERSLHWHDQRNEL